MVRNIQKKGQVTLLAVILGVLGLTLGLSVASRSLSDLRQASTVDFGTKALAAAESGAEYGLNQLNLLGSGAVNCPAVGNGTELVNNGITFPPELGIVSLKYKICESGDSFARSNGPVNKDDVYQVNFLAPYNGDIEVSWAGGAQAVQINALSLNAGVYTIARYAFRSQDTDLLTSNFTNSSSGVSLISGCDSSFGALSNVRRSGSINMTNLVLLRVTPLAAANLPTPRADIMVCGDPALPSQYYEVESTAETKNGTTKRVSVRRDIAGTLPGIFDNVLFSGGDINKQ